MNMLAAQAEMALWSSDIPDRSVIDTTVDEFPQRMGQFTDYMANIYKQIIDDYIAPCDQPN